MSAFAVLASSEGGAASASACARTALVLSSVSGDTAARALPGARRNTRDAWGTLVVNILEAAGGMAAKLTPVEKKAVGIEDRLF